MDQGTRIDVTECYRCAALSDSRSRIVNGVGPVDADLLFVGEAPGEREDQEGEPFVGRSGELLEQVLKAQGLSRDSVRITNAVKCRPPGNRDPTRAELHNCRPYLDREIVTVDPEVVITLGKVPSQHLLDRSVAVTTEAGTSEKIRIGETSYSVLVGLHPAATLYDPSTRDAFEAVIETAASMAGP